MRNQSQFTMRTRGYLPHLELPGATYAVTFRLADSLPQSILEFYRRERQAIVETAEQMNRPLTPQDESRLDELFSDKIQTALDQGIGQCHFRQPAVAKVVFDALKFFHTTRYQLHTWCVMPNHVHCLLTPSAANALCEILHSWKSYTATEANKILERGGEFWMPEYYDHLIRDEADFLHNHHYILNNPAKANLKNWPWVATVARANVTREAK